MLRPPMPLPSPSRAHLDPTGSSPSTDRPGASLVHAILLTTGWLVAESVYVVAADPGLRWVALPFGIGAGVPWALLLTAGLALTSLAWGRWLGAESGATALRAAVGRVLRPESPEKAAHFTAVLAACVFWGLLWLGGGFAAGAVIAERLVDPTFQRVAWLLVMGGLTFALLVAFPLLAWPLRRLFALGARVPFVGAAVRPLGLLLFVVIVLLGMLVTFLVLLPDLARTLPWALLLGPVCGLVLSGLLGPVVLRTPRRARVACFSIAGCALLLGGLAALLPRSLAEHRSVFLGTGSLTRTVLALVTPALDFDGDGSVGLYGGGDCAPLDPKRSPATLEIANNGIDENCSGADLKFERNRFTAGKTAHPLPPSAPRRPHVILLTTDALSYSHTNLAAYPRSVTPNLAAWAKRATVFERGFAVAPSTRFSFPVLMAGVYNSQIKLTHTPRIPYPWDAGTLTLAEILASKGYFTVAIPGDAYFSPARWGGFTQGFDAVELEPIQRPKDPYHTAPEITAKAIEHVERTRESDKPLFLWIHYFDQHPPYSVPSGEKPLGAATVDRYDAELTFADRHWGRLLETIERTWKPEEYVVVFTSDHGEAFDKNHPVDHHNSSIHTAVLHVPFVVQTAERRGERLQDLVAHGDVVPTLANLVGQTPRKDWHGESLVPVLWGGQKVEKNVVYALTYLDEASRLGKDPFFTIGLRTPDLYYYENRRKEESRLVRWPTDLLDERDLRLGDPQTAEVFQYLAAQKVADLKHTAQSLTRYFKAEGGATTTPSPPPKAAPRKKTR